MMYLKDLIEFLENQPEHKVVKDGFGEPHTDRGFYENLAFDPVAVTTYGEMLRHAKSALDHTFVGWKGGDYTMHEYTECLIGEFGCCGEAINSATLKLWKLTEEE